MTARRITLDSASLIGHVFHNHLFHNQDCCILDADLFDLSATFVKLPLSCRKNDDTKTT